MMATHQVPNTFAFVTFEQNLIVGFGDLVLVQVDGRVYGREHAIHHNALLGGFGVAEFVYSPSSGAYAPMLLSSGRHYLYRWAFGSRCK